MDEHVLFIQVGMAARVLQLTSVICIERQAIVICKVSSPIFERRHCESRCLPPAHLHL